MAFTKKVVFIFLFLIYHKIACIENKRRERDYVKAGSEMYIEKRIFDYDFEENSKDTAQSPKKSNTLSKAELPAESRGYAFGSVRSKRYAQKPDQSIAALRKKLFEDKKKEMKDKKKEKEPMLNDPRMEPNDTGSPTTHTPTDLRYGGINTQQTHVSANDKVRQLMSAYKKNLPTVDPLTGCNFETPCNWKSKSELENGFKVSVSEQNGTGPMTDADGNKTGHFLLHNLISQTRHSQIITSPLLLPSRERCKIELWIYQEAMENGQIRIVIEGMNRTQWVIETIEGDNSKRWNKYNITIGKISQNFQIIFEILPAISPSIGARVAIDNIKLNQCFPENDTFNTCMPYKYKCSDSSRCINKTEVCDFVTNCDSGDDETQNCERIPYGGRCNFEEDWCGWTRVEGKVLQWTRHNGSTPTNRTGPDFDHTYENSTGKYLYVNMATEKAVFGSIATVKSIVFNPPPPVHGNASSQYYNSCMVRFFLHQTGVHKSGIMLQVTELRPSDNSTTDMFWSYYDYGNAWIRQVAILPNITHRYYLHFDAKKGMRYIGDIAIDDISLSPECFGLNIPESDLNGYNYYNYDSHGMFKEPHSDFADQVYYKITTCGATGRYGPNQEQCNENSDNNTDVSVLNRKFRGVQKWTVPSESFYTIILFGASGGKGSVGMGSSRGSMVRIVVELWKGQELYFLVGQEGSSACIKSLEHNPGPSSCLTQNTATNLTGIRGVLNMDVVYGGGGGGGGTFLFLYNSAKQPVPLAVASGGGGLGLGKFIDNGMQHGQAINMSKPPFSGKMHGDQTAGAGGGWRKFKEQVTTLEQELMMGWALLDGATGGKACYNATDGQGDGGFGGGGGGCTMGGGGGGYAGGSIYKNLNTTNGEGGYSFINPNRTIPSHSEAHSGYNAGPGYVLILPAVPGCGCDYRCLALDAKRSQVACICPKNWKLATDNKTCLLLETSPQHPTWFVVLLIATVICLTVAFAVVCSVLYNRYQQRKAGLMQRKMLSGHDLQLNRLRGVASDSMMTEYNPSYEFGGIVYTLKDLKDIPRDQLRLVKALGQGAFGEVYQGFYRQRSGDTVEMPVAVKTLPEMSTNQAEMDFLMEALIMSKFHHANIVHFIGVCFDKHPRFIVLELLAGGDLKNFLRESRPKPERSSSLSMRDLVLIAVDVAKGCRYLEENRFIHRDIAARNCLLTTKGPGRVVKIADFGMSRDVYRSDYYRKGGKAMLPIKWMPPEAFLDGVFTSKTDVWSFGVLLWEILSMGYMPYTGLSNREVMQLVTSGGRLEPPTNCPGPIYGIMTQCWHPAPEQRPSFALILERMDYCTQDPQVMNAPLPVFSRPPSHERDATVMRPNNSDDSCLQVPQSTDYLIPNHTNFSALPNSVGSTSSVDKLLPENSDSWETSFVMPHSRSTQPLLQESEQNTTEDAGSIEKLLSVDSPQNAVHKVSPISLPNNVLSNHNNNVKHDSVLKSGVSLDAGALAKQTMPAAQKKSYANVNTGDNVTGNGVLPNGPFTVQNQNSYNSNKFLNESEISC